MTALQKIQIHHRPYDPESSSEDNWKTFVHDRVLTWAKDGPMPASVFFLGRLGDQPTEFLINMQGLIEDLSKDDVEKVLREILEKCQAHHVMTVFEAFIHTCQQGSTEVETRDALCMIEETHEKTNLSLWYIQDEDGERKLVFESENSAEEQTPEVVGGRFVNLLPAPPVRVLH